MVFMVLGARPGHSRQYQDGALASPQAAADATGQTSDMREEGNASISVNTISKSCLLGCMEGEV